MSTQSGPKTHVLRLTVIFKTLAFLLLTLSFSALVFAQSTTAGGISGHVYDPHDALVANATVTVRNNGTNLEQTTTTDSSGYYRVTNLTPATYTVAVSAQGFSPYKAQQVIVEIGRMTDVSPHLTVGGGAEQLVVTAEAPEVNTTSANFDSQLNTLAIQNLPINGGRWSDFALLTPGVNNDLNGFGLLSFRGISTLLNNTTIDGADNNQAFFSEERGRTRAGYSTAKIAVQEFQVNTSDYSAEYGRAAGGVINTVTKSGTNAFHGDAYYYIRDSAWSSINPFTTITTQTSPGTFTTHPFKPSDIRRISGADIGGPLIKDKLFFYFAFDWYYRNFPGTGVAGNPNSFFAAPSNATIATLASRLGVSNAQAATDYSNGLNGINSVLGSVPRTGTQTIWFPKIDWNINQKNSVSISVNRMRWNSPAGIQTQSAVNFGIASFGNDYVKDTWLVAQLNSTLSTNVVNQFRFQYGRDFEYENSQPPTPYEQNNLVTPPGYTNPLGLPPQVVLISASTLTFGTPSFLERPAYPDERRQQYADVATVIWGKHTFKFGGDIIHTNDNTQNLRFQYGAYSYSSLLNYFSDFYAPNTCTATVNNKQVQVPCYSNYQQAFGPLGITFSTDDLDFFAEDTWKMTPRFTLTLGLRYEFQTMPGTPNANPLVPATGKLPSDKNNLGPRIGFAYDIFGDGTTSLRGGFGMYYGRIINSTIYNALINTGTANAQLSYFFTNTQGGPVFPQILSSLPTGPAGKPAIQYFDGNFQAPLIYETDLSFQRELGRNTVLSISYLGSLGRELPDFVDTNLPAPTQISYVVAGGPAASKGVPCSFDPTRVCLTGLFYGGARPNTNFGAMTDIFSGINSTYNALSASLNKRYSNHLQFAANYTWSHAIDYGQNEQTFTATNSLLIPSCLKCEYGDSIFDVRQRFALSLIGDTPWNVKGWAAWLANGWQIAPILQFQTGLPYSLVTSGTPTLPACSTTFAGFTCNNGSSVTGIGSSVNGSGGATRLLETGQNTYRYPSTYVVDLSVSKNFQLKERYSLQILAQAFNLFNHLNVTSILNTGYVIQSSSIAGKTVPVLNFNSTLSTAPFGYISNANSNFAYSTRQLQLGAKFSF
jgi:Carboxypeptidase regulatory-like domain/TonB dependent receptor